MFGGLVAVLAALVWVPAADAHGRMKTCSIFHSNALEPHAAWRGYGSGTNCGAATAVLIAVLHGQGQIHNGSDQADSYIIYHGWKCAFEGMGSQLCWRPVGSYSHATAQIVAIDCNNVNGCPAKFPSY
jgi:hypothetical protein